MWSGRFVRLKNEFIEIILTIQRIIMNPLMMTLHYLWIVITFQEKNSIKNAKKLAEQDKNNNEHRMPNEFIQGAAVIAETASPSLILRSALKLQFWMFYWNLERERVHLSRTLPASLTSPGQLIPETAKLIPVLTEKINLLNEILDENIPIISLRSLMKKGRYLVVNFGSCT
ncbi:unnamed protein product [Adineta ricciae]|uniref:Uncharacterized protein n=1 Tax=Adineta ricciae TaxID=249248 RepID=A0A816GSJ1_ADIRI|nr:unnamed protein product [Adineta ricciae]